MTQLVLLLKSNPNVESALEFLSNEEGYIYKQIRNKLWGLKEGKFENGSDILIDISNKLSDYFPEFKRSIVLLISSLNEKDREANLNRALKICLDGVNERFERYSQSLVLPTMILFSIGTVIPLVTITMLPILSFFNFNLFLTSIILLVSLLFLYLYSNQIISKRPFSFEEYNVKLTRTNYYWSLIILIILSIPAIVYFLNYLPGVKFKVLPEGYNLIWIVIGLSFSLSIFFYKISYKPKMEVDNINRIEMNIPTIGYKLSTIVGEGKPIDEEVNKLKDETPREKLLKHLVELMKEKGTKRLYELLIKFSDYFNMIDKIKFSLIMKLHNTIQMMKLTAVIFIPLVAGISSGLALIMKDNIGKNNFFNYNINVEFITLLTGLYSIFLLLLLIRYTIYLENGPNKVKFYYESSKYLPIALFIFILSFVMISKVVP